MSKTYLEEYYGASAHCHINYVPGISYSIKFDNFEYEEPDINTFEGSLEQYEDLKIQNQYELVMNVVEKNLEVLYKKFSTIQMNGTMDGDYQFLNKQTDETKIENRVYQIETARYSRSSIDREAMRDAITKQFYPLWKYEDAVSFLTDVGDTHTNDAKGSSISSGGTESDPEGLEDVNSFEINFMFPYEYYPAALSVNMRLKTGALTNYVKFCPYNDDRFCIMHCLYNELFVQGKTTFKSLTNDKEYMQEFTAWFNENKLDDYYDQGNFRLHALNKLEDQLKISINVYTYETKDVRLYYRSRYLYDKIAYLAIIPLERFYNRKTETAKDAKKIKYESPVFTQYNDTKDFIQGHTLKDFCSESHCVVFKKSFFGDQKNYLVCRYCTYSCDKQVTMDTHEPKCREMFMYAKLEDRTKNYTELADPVKKFKQFHALYRVPFAVYDFETRICPNTKQHIPLSYILLYFNVFEPEKSIIRMKSNFCEPEELITKFLDDVEYISKHHYFLQSVDKPLEYNSEFKDFKCTLCLTDRLADEFNHTHFQGDNLNKHLDKHICGDCNKKMMIKNKPLQIYAHNASKFDQNLFIKQLIDSKKFTRFNITSKNESRFSKVTVCLTENTAISCEFKDSLMLIMGSLAEISGAWIDKVKHRPIIKTLIDKFYHNLDDEKLEELVNNSLKKQVFPYNALNNEKTLYEKEPLGMDWFVDDLAIFVSSKELEKYIIKDSMNEKINSVPNLKLRYFEAEQPDIYNDIANNYKEYLEVNKMLKSCINMNNHGSFRKQGENWVVRESTNVDYNFFDFHDYYLLLDGILLALSLFGFMETSFGITGVNPLWFLSASAYSNAAMLYGNLRSNAPQIIIPNVEEQLYLQRSVRGGFTSIFNRLYERKDKDLVLYQDVSSLYPTTYLQKMPYAFDCEIPATMKNYRDIIDNIDDKYLYFIEVDIAALDKKYHKRNSILPLFPENMIIKEDMISEDQQMRYKANYGKDYKPVAINTVSFYAKKNYVCMCEYLREAEKLGYVIEKIHTIKRYKADYITREYCEKLYKIKQDLTNEINSLDPKDPRIPGLKARISVVKILLNGYFGFNLTRSDKFSKCEIIDGSNEKIVKKRISSMRFKSFLKTDENYVMNMSPASIQLCYSTMIGSAILWKSKLVMMKYVYNLYDYIEKMTGRSDLFYSLFTDTDSYAVVIKDFYKYFDSKDRFMYDFNKNVYKCFDTTHFKDKLLQMPETHGAIGLLTDETENKKNIDKFVGLCAKVYCIVFDDQEMNVKSKGIRKSDKKRLLNYEFYKDVVTGKALKWAENDQMRKDNIKKANKKNNKEEIKEVEGRSLEYSYTQIKSTKMTISNILSKKRLVTLFDLKYRYDNGINYKVHGS